MSYSIPESVSNCDCECGTGQVKSDIACPTCRKLGSTINFVTPQNTLIKDARTRLDENNVYHFCDNPECDTVYYNEQDTSVFTHDELKNRVTIKDDSPKTPLCYCFKVLKEQALKDIAETGTTDVFKTIQSKMKPGQSCFCEKSNPRGDTCVQDIVAWLEEQGVSTEVENSKEIESNNCCGDDSPTTSLNNGCCGSSAQSTNNNSGCCS